MEVNREILIKAEKILADKEAEEKYLERCKEARVCPACGEESKFVYERPTRKIGSWLFSQRYVESGYECTECEWNTLEESEYVDDISADMI